MSGLIVACVLRASRVYTPEWVQRLQRGVERHLSIPHRFVTLSDVDVEGVERIPLQTDWPTWWAKMELFRPGTFPAGSRVLYFDLDTIIVGGLEALATWTGGGFAMLSDFYHPDQYASGVMAWRVGQLDRVFAQFEAGSHLYIREMIAGDQQFLAMHTANPHVIQHIDPGVRSFKVHCLQGAPQGTTAVCFHGFPRPDDLPPTNALYKEWTSQ